MLLNLRLISAAESKQFLPASVMRAVISVSFQEVAGLVTSAFACDCKLYILLVIEDLINLLNDLLHLLNSPVE